SACQFAAKRVLPLKCLDSYAGLTREYEILRPYRSSTDRMRLASVQRKEIQRDTQGLRSGRFIHGNPDWQVCRHSAIDQPASFDFHWVEKNRHGGAREHVLWRDGMVAIVEHGVFARFDIDRQD